MPRYFLDIAQGDRVERDERGVMCRDDDFALEQAWAALPALVERADRKRMCQSYEFIVRREDGLQVGCLGITLDMQALDPLVSATLDAYEAHKPLHD